MYICALSSSSLAAIYSTQSLPLRLPTGFGTYLHCRCCSFLPIHIHTHNTPSFDCCYTLRAARAPAAPLNNSTRNPYNPQMLTPRTHQNPAHACVFLKKIRQRFRLPNKKENRQRNMSRKNGTLFASPIAPLNAKLSYRSCHAMS